MKYNMSSVIKKAILGGIVVIFAFIIILSFNDIKTTINVIKKANVENLLICLGIVVAYLFFYVLSFHILMRSRKINIRTRDIYLIGITEPFFNGITPSSSGGQPFQMYAYYRRGVSLKDSSVTLLMNFIVFMLGNNIFAFTSLIYYDEYVAKIPNFTWIVIFGFAMNFFILFFFLALALSKHARNIMIAFVGWLSRRKLLKKVLAGKQEKFIQYCDGVQEGCKAILKNPLAFILAFISKMIAIALYNVLPFYGMRALGLDLSYDYFFYVMLGTAFATAMVIWMPTPGAVGGIELAFSSIFITLPGTTKAIATAGMCIWRLYTFYLLLIVGFSCYMIFEMKEKKYRKYLAEHEIEKPENNDEAAIDTVEVINENNENDEKEEL